MSKLKVGNFVMSGDEMVLATIVLGWIAVIVLMLTGAA
jgi:hypothetical protein